MHYGHGHTTSDQILDQGSLGIDTHITFASDILTQMRLYLQQTRLSHYEAARAAGELPYNNPMSVNQAFLLGTRNGGLALKRPDIGVLQVGAVADIVVFDTSRIGVLGWQDPVATVVLHMNPGDIDTVIVNGAVKKTNKTLLVGPSNSQRATFLSRQASFLDAFYKQNFTEWEIGLFTDSGINPNVASELAILDVTRGVDTGY